MHAAKLSSATSEAGGGGGGGTGLGAFGGGSRRVPAHQATNSDSLAHCVRPRGPSVGVKKIYRAIFRPSSSCAMSRFFGFICSTPDGRKQAVVCGAAAAAELAGWSEWPEAREGTERLAAALADAGGAPLTGAVYQLLRPHERVEEKELLQRRVHCTPGFDESALPAPVQQLMPFTTRGEVHNFDFFVLLAHTFGALRLTTLVVKHGEVTDPDWAISRVFGTASVAISATESLGGASVFTDVARGGERLSAADLAAMPHAQRGILREAQKAQLLSATAVCIAEGWAPGFSVLRAAAVRGRPALSAPLEALHLRLSATTALGTSQPSCEKAFAGIRHAEQLEARGLYDEAAACYKKVIEEDMRSPGLLPTPALVWIFYGLALKRAGRFPEAEAVYEATLAALPRLRFQPDTPHDRESTRLDLLHKLCIIHYGKNAEKLDSCHARLFRQQAELLRELGDEPLFFTFPSQRHCEVVLGLRTRRRWALEPNSHVPTTGADGNQAFKYNRIIEQSPAPPGWPSEELLSRGSGVAVAEVDARMSRVAMRGQLPKLPQLPRSCGPCAKCGNEATKRCSACDGVFYCGADCQNLDWPAHRAACKAARKANEAASRGAA